jgi:hypothetical protein
LPQNGAADFRRTDNNGNLIPGVFMLADTVMWLIGIVTFVFAVHSVASVPKEIVKADDQQEQAQHPGDGQSPA